MKRILNYIYYLTLSAFSLLFGLLLLISLAPNNNFTINERFAVLGLLLLMVAVCAHSMTMFMDLNRKQS